MLDEDGFRLSKQGNDDIRFEALKSKAENKLDGSMDSWCLLKGESSGNSFETDISQNPGDSFYLVLSFSVMTEQDKTG